MNLELIQIIQGSFSLIFAVITLVLGIRIILRYFENKSREYVLIGTSWISMAMIWIPDSISFLMIIFLNVPLDNFMNIVIGLTFIPIGLLSWLIAWSDLMYKEKQKTIIFLALIFVIIYEFIFWSLILTDLSLIATFIGPFQVKQGLFIIISSIIVISVFLSTGVMFSWRSMKSDSPEINLRGKLFLIAILSFSIGAFLESSIPLTSITVVITRSILISSSIEFYLAFALPKWFKNIILKE